MKGVTDNLNTGQNSVKSPKPPSLASPVPEKFLKSSRTWIVERSTAVAVAQPPVNDRHAGASTEPSGVNSQSGSVYGIVTETAVDGDLDGVGE